MARVREPLEVPERPDLVFETGLWQCGFSLVAGMDEAGRGAWAGPVSAAAVVFQPSFKISSGLTGVNDSKKLTPEQRFRLAAEIKTACLSWGVGFASSSEIDEIGILPSTRLAMERALSGLQTAPSHLLLDFITLPDLDLPQTSLVKGDARSFSIAAASILAKTARDEWMKEQNDRYPGYGWGSNMGYGTAAHRLAIQSLGLTPIHRRSFNPMTSLFS